MRRATLAILAIATVIVVFALSATPVLARGKAEPDEVKAAFLYNFAKFVAWPKAPSGRYVFCVWSDEAFAETLRRTLDGEILHEREIVVRHVETLDQLSHLEPLHVLYVPTSEERVYAEILDVLAGAAVLTVGDEPRFTEIGGMISFEKRHGKIRFAIHRGAVETSGLDLGSQLLGLARLVDSR